MLSKLFIAWCLMAGCVAIHAGGTTAAMRWLRHERDTPLRHLSLTWLFIKLAGWMILFHLCEIGLWALLYYWDGALDDFSSALYFSAATYTTTGYGDLVLGSSWRLACGVEALTGILMCGWTTAYFFAIFSRVYGTQGKGAELGIDP